MQVLFWEDFRKMIKKCSVLLLCLAVLSFFAACGKENTENPEDTTGKIPVSVTFNAMKEFTEAVGGDKVSVTTIIPDGTEPHDFEPKAQDLAKLTTAKVFVYNGLGMESWVAETLGAVDNKELVSVDASKGVTAIATAKGGGDDPHLWLSLKGAVAEVENIRDGLVKADPGNAAYYEANCKSYVAQLESLYDDYSAKFATVTKKDFVTGHAAFAYLCRDFGLTQNSVEDVFAEGEPSAKHLTELVQYCKENDVTTIFAEEMASPEVSKTLAKEAGAEVKTIYTMESNEDNLSYLKRMENNLKEIYESLAQ